MRELEKMYTSEHGNQEAGQTTLTIDSREVATMTGKEHKKLLRDIRGYINYLNESNFGPVEFFVEDNYIDNKGEERPCYLLTRKGCDMVANKMTGKKGVLFTAAYVTKFEEMEKELMTNQFSLPTTYKEALLKLVEAEEEKERLIATNKIQEDKLLEQAPKMEIYNQFIESDTTYTVNEIAKVLAIPGMGRNNLYKFLRWNKIIIDDGYETYQRYIDQGYVEHITRSYQGADDRTFTEIACVFTPKGIEWLYKKLKKNGYATKKSMEQIAKELKK